MEKKINEAAVRKMYFDILFKYAKEVLGEDAHQFETGAFGFPVTDENGIEGTVTVYVKVPRGSHDGEPFDIYTAAEDYKIETAAKAEKKAMAEKKKAAKIAADQKAREEKRKRLEEADN